MILEGYCEDQEGFSEGGEIEPEVEVGVMRVVGKGES